MKQTRLSIQKQKQLVFLVFVSLVILYVLTRCLQGTHFVSVEFNIFRAKSVNDETESKIPGESKTELTFQKSNSKEIFRKFASIGEENGKLLHEKHSKSLVKSSKELNWITHKTKKKRGKMKGTQLGKPNRKFLPENFVKAIKEDCQKFLQEIVDVKKLNLMNTTDEEAWQRDKKVLIQTYHRTLYKQDEEEANQSLAVACQPPVLDPFHPNALKAWTFNKKEECSIKKYGRIENSSLIVENPNGKVIAARVQYIRRGRQRFADGRIDNLTLPDDIIMHYKYKYSDVLNDDFHVHFTDPIDLNSTDGKFILKPLTEDFISLSLLVKLSNQTSPQIIKEFHSFISNPQKVCRPRKKIGTKSKGLKYNVAMVMLDAQSRSNLYRQMPRLMRLLHSNQDVMLFKKHGIHGDGTTSQMMAALAGKY